jgi:Kef-type K+ transport system membrane component KefB
MVPLVTGQQEGLSLSGTGLIIGKAVLFFLAVTVVGIWVFPHGKTGWLSRIPLLGRAGLKDLLAFDKGKHATLQVLLLALLSALIGHQLGFHPAVGAYMAGLIMREEYFRRGRKPGSFRDTTRIIDNVAFTWIGPVFFVELGTKLVFDWDIFVAVIPQTIVLTVGIIVSQVVSASLAARYTGGMKPAASMMIGFGMLGRAELAFVVMDIAYVQHKILSVEAFYTLMFTCFWLNIAVPLLIHWWKPRCAAEEAAAAAGSG